jgi:hypothetical protein
LPLQLQVAIRPQQFHGPKRNIEREEWQRGKDL